MANTQLTLKLPDGRTLGYAEFGAETGEPLIYCHGLPACRLEGALIHEAARALNIRVICPDRPGYGLSSPRQEGVLADWPGDLVQLASQLGLQGFAVLGISGGGPYALACAWAIPERLKAAAIVGGLGPVDVAWARHCMGWPARLGFGLAHRSRRYLAWLYGDFTARLMHWNPELAHRLLMIGAPPVDRRTLARSSINRILCDSVREALKDGAAGALRDFTVLAQPWGFRVSDIAIPVTVWQGEADRIVPPAHGRYFANSLGQVLPRFLPEEGHFSLPVDHAEVILRDLMGKQGGSTNAKPSASDPERK